jgi:hypothetical protein
MAILTLKKEDQIVSIAAGELISYRASGHEFIHQKGNPGWRNSDTEMFPIIGPTNEAGFRVSTPKGPAVQDQHGLLREMPYELLEHTPTKAVFQKEYKANTPIKNAKYPDKSTEEWLSWPYDFGFTKTFQLTKDGLEVVFGITGAEGMPFMLGYHPAFALYGMDDAIVANGLEISIAEVMAVGSRAMPLLGTQSLTLQGKRNLRLTSMGFSHFMLWTEVPNMVCIEPITFYPYAVAQDHLHQGFDVLSGEATEYGLRLIPV